MSGSMMKSILGVLALGAMVLGLSAPVLAQGVPGPPPTGPVDDLQTALSAILDQVGPCNIPPVWGKKFAGAERFVAVLDGSAYCDQETGLVWEARPGDTDSDMDVDNDDRVSWPGAISHCNRLEVDGRKGWTLPLVEQLATLVDENSALCTGGGACLPDDHPFQDVQSATYWSASSNADTPTDAWLVRFGDGIVGSTFKDLGLHAWCVRGDQSFDGNTHETLH